MRIKFTEKSLDAARDHADKVKERIGELNIFLSRFDAEFWKSVVTDLDARIENLVIDRDSNFKAMTEAQLKANVAEERAYRTIKTLPERVEKNRNQLIKDQNTLLQDIHDRASRIKV